MSQEYPTARLSPKRMHSFEYDLYSSSVQPSQSREGTLWARGANRHAARDPEESGKELARVHPNARWRWGGSKIIFGSLVNFLPEEGHRPSNHVSIEMKQQKWSHTSPQRDTSCLWYNHTGTDVPGRWSSALCAPIVSCQNFLKTSYYSADGSAECVFHPHTLLWFSFYLCLQSAIRYCKPCQLIKPDRCHHCSTCET